MALSKNSSNNPSPKGSGGQSGEQSQAEFEMEFFGRVLDRKPDYIDVLRIMGNLLTLKGHFHEGLEIDKKLVQLRPDDALAFYNLACSFALLNQKEESLSALERSVELGYRDFQFMKQDRDLETIRQDPRFCRILQDFEKR